MNVKQIVFLILGTIFLILGLIGLALPVIPQIPFLITAVVLFAGALPVFKKRLMCTKIYKEHGAGIVERFRILKTILGETEEEYKEILEEVTAEAEEEGRNDEEDTQSVSLMSRTQCSTSPTQGRNDEEEDSQHVSET